MFYSELLPKSPTAAAQARGLLERIRSKLSPRALDDARLLVSELVTNAVEHVSEDGDIEIRVQLNGDTLRVEVLDPGGGFTPTPRGPGASRESGWGLHFTERIAQRWAVDVEGRARVWFELKAR